jgi:hypothetical protein
VDLIIVPISELNGHLDQQLPEIVDTGFGESDELFCELGAFHEYDKLIEQFQKAYRDGEIETVRSLVDDNGKVIIRDENDQELWCTSIHSTCKSESRWRSRSSLSVLEGMNWL